jgi:hypothetical protein
MHHITKYFKSRKAAEKYETLLSSQVPYVCLIDSPIWGDSGRYTWEVSMWIIRFALPIKTATHSAT